MVSEFGLGDNTWIILLQVKHQKNGTYHKGVFKYCVLKAEFLGCLSWGETWAIPADVEKPADKRRKDEIV